MMNRQQIYLLVISFFIGFSTYAQTVVSDTLADKRQMFIGVDLLNPIAGLFSNKDNFNGFISYKIKDRWIGVVELGYEKNVYRKDEWDVEAKGIYGEIGINYILTNNYEQTGEGFYVGGRLGFSPFKQNIKKYPIKGMNSEGLTEIVGYGSLSEANVSSGWFEAVAGAKVQILESPFYIDLMIKPKFLIFSEKQEGIDNLAIPGYGKDRGAANISIFWGVSYKLF